jgi:CBS domain-containing protein
MREQNIGFVPVVDDQDKLCGTVTDRDLTLRIVADGHDPNTPLSDAVTPYVVTCHADHDLREAEQKMASAKKSRIICVDEDGRIAGVISLSDVAQAEEATQTARVLAEITKREAPALH